MGVLDTARGFLSRLTGKGVYTLDEWAQRFASAVDEGEAASDSGVDVSRPYSQCAWAYAAVNLIARNVARVPFVVHEGGEHGPAVKSGPIARLTERPNRRQHWQEFVEASMTRLLLGGHIFWERRGLVNGVQPTEVMLHDLSKLRAEVARDEIGNDFARRWIRRQTGEPLIPDDEVFEWKLVNPYDDVYGLSPLTAAQLALYGDRAAWVYNKAFFENGARPGIVFTTDDERFTQKEADAAQARWNAQRRGARRAHQAAFMGNGLTPHNTGHTHADMEFPTLKQLSKSEILAVYQVPDTLLGAQPKTAGVEIGNNNRKPDEENFILNTVMTWADQFAWFFDHVVTAPFGNYWSQFDFRQVPILQDRLLERAKEGREWTKCGATFNDVNELFNLGFQPQPTGNDWWVPANMLPARLLMNGPIAAEQPKDHRDSADAKEAKKSLRLLEVA